MNLQVRINLTEEQLKTLACSSRLLREEPRKHWTTKEYQEHARFTVARLVQEFLEKNNE